MQITPTFSSVLVELRPFKSDDLPALSAYLNHPDLTGRRYIPWDFPNDVPLSEQQVEGVLKKWGEKKKGFVLAVRQRESVFRLGKVYDNLVMDLLREEYYNTHPELTDNLPKI